MITLLAFTQCHLSAVGLRDVVPLEEDTGDAARFVADRLVDEVQYYVAAWQVRRVAQRHRKAFGNETLARRIDAVQHFEQALAFNFRENVTRRASEVIALSGKASHKPAASAGHRGPGLGILRTPLGS